MFDGLKDMKKLLDQAKDMKAKMQEVQKELKGTIVEGTDSGNNIKVVMTGEIECTEIKILNSAILSDNARLEAALKKAVNEASTKAKNIATQKLSVVSGGLKIPGLT